MFKQNQLCCGVIRHCSDDLIGFCSFPRRSELEFLDYWQTRLAEETITLSYDLTQSPEFTAVLKVSPKLSPIERVTLEI